MREREANITRRDLGVHENELIIPSKDQAWIGRFFFVYAFEREKGRTCGPRSIFEQNKDRNDDVGAIRITRLNLLIL